MAPSATELLPKAVNILAHLNGTRLAVMGDGLATDCYGKAAPPAALDQISATALVIDAKLGPHRMQPILAAELAKLNALPEWQVVDDVTGEPIWGVEWLPAKVNGRMVINAVNLLRAPVQVKIIHAGHDMPVTDLLSLGARGHVETLQPMVPVLCAFDQGTSNR